VKEIVGDTMCIIGGMPNSMLKTDTGKKVREHTRKVCQTVGKNGGFIMCPSVIEMSGSRPPLVTAWVEATREYGVY
jgi:uroporphyrinogen-III decarboxylase